jgi:hypothetical protein
MRDNNNPSWVHTLAAMAFCVAMTIAFHSHVKKTGRLPFQPITWRPEATPAPPTEFVLRPTKVIQGRYGQPRVIDDPAFEPRLSPGAPPDVWDGYRWRYRR